MKRVATSVRPRSVTVRRLGTGAQPNATVSQLREFNQRLETRKFWLVRTSLFAGFSCITATVLVENPDVFHPFTLGTFLGGVLIPMSAGAYSFWANNRIIANKAVLAKF